MSNRNNIQELRNITGLGLLECKRAIEQANGNMEEAIIILRKKSNTTIVDISKREAREGRIESYIHVGAKAGVIIEVNCQTDFVANNEEFASFCRDLSLQIVALNPTYIRREDIPADLLEQEKSILRDSLLSTGKSMAAIDNIVNGKLEKYFSMICLVDQPFVKDQNKTIKEIINEKITKFGENIIVKRFTRYQLGT